MEAFLYGALAAISLPIGAAIGTWLRPSVRVTGAVMAFGAGALLAAMSFELVLPALENGSFASLALGLASGCAAFVGLNHLLNVRGAFLRKAATLAHYARSRKRREVQETLRVLSRVDILRSLPPEELQELVTSVIHTHASPGDVVFAQGDPGDALYIVESGQVAILRKDGERTRTLANLGPGKSFGEMALVSNEARMASAVALEPLELWKFPSEPFLRILETSPALRESVDQLVAERVTRNQALVTAEEWRMRALDTLDREALMPSPTDVQEVIREARSRGAVGFAIWLGSALDGVGESVVIGASTLGAAVSLPLIGGVFISNLPESMASAATLRRQKIPGGLVIGLWGSLVLLSGATAVAGRALLADQDPQMMALAQGMAAGAILAMIAQTMLPEAFEGGGGPAVALMTVAGFVFALFLGVLAGGM
jgi:CRP-like cAMP-binding protein